jgi:hypothetical protein
MKPHLNHFQKRLLRIKIVEAFQRADSEERIPDFEELHRQLDVSVRTLKRYYRDYQREGPLAVIEIHDGPHGHMEFAGHRYWQWMRNMAVHCRGGVRRSILGLRQEVIDEHYRLMPARPVFPADTSSLESGER